MAVTVNISALLHAAPWLVVGMCTFHTHIQVLKKERESESKDELVWEGDKM